MTTEHTARQFAEQLHGLAALDLVHAPADTVLFLTPGKAPGDGHGPLSFARPAYDPGDTVVWLRSMDWYNTPVWLYGTVVPHDVETSWAAGTGRVRIAWDDGAKSVELPEDIAPAFRIVVPERN